MTEIEKQLLENQKIIMQLFTHSFPSGEQTEMQRILKDGLVKNINNTHKLLRNERIRNEKE